VKYLEHKLIRWDLEEKKTVQADPIFAPTSTTRGGRPSDPSCLQPFFKILWKMVVSTGAKKPSKKREIFIQSRRSKEAVTRWYAG